MEQQDNIFTINHQYFSTTYEGINNIPSDTEILNIEFLILKKGQVFENLPPLIKEINITALWALGLGGRLGSRFGHGWFEYNDNLSIVKLIKIIFPKIPFGCKIYYTNEDDE